MIDQSLHNQLRERFNPDGSDLRKLQLRLLDMLKYIDSVCRKNNIHYWISSGTALGAVRHGGFIPWDDDADIELLKPDYKRLIEALKRDNHPRYKLQEASTDVEYTGIVAKLRDSQSKVAEEIPGEKHLTYQGVFVDLFCIEPSISPKLNTLSHWMQLVFLYHASRIKHKFLRRSILRLNRFWLTKLIFPIMSSLGRLGEKERLRHVIGSGFPAKRSASDVKEIVYVDFEDTKLPVPHNYDSYLSGLFGNYMKIPSPDNIHIHLKKIEGL